MKKAECAPCYRMLSQAMLSNFTCALMLSSLVMLTASGVRAESFDGVDGEYGVLTVTGDLVDSPCHLSMDSRDQTIDLGMLAASELKYPGARSRPVQATVRLEGCLPAAGNLYDTQTGAVTISNNQPVVDVAFSAPTDSSSPSLVKLTGVKGIALRMTDDKNRVVRFGSHGKQHILSPGDNILHWTIVAERVQGPLLPGAFRAVTDFKLSYY
ncbi:type 1 fimbrial protein [Salmonella enterica subsp. enterica]|nr:type 1 fimbrial protein [Salmonella enterica subsp. enterica]